MSFIFGVLVGVAITLYAIYASIALYRYEIPEPPNRVKEHGVQRGLIDLENSRDVWLNYLLNFLYREFCHSDLLHDFVLRKIKVELDELHKGPANRILSKLEIKDYEFGSHCPIIKNIKQTEPEGLDSEVLPDSFSIEFDVDYNIQDDIDGSPFQMSADAVPIFFGSVITVTIKILKCKGRVRLHLSRSPIPFWYVSFVEKPDLDIKISTNLNNRYATTLENLFTTHITRMVQRRHTVPKFKLRHSPFFSPDHYILKPKDDWETEDVSCSITITASRGRGFPCAHSNDNPSSNCFVTFVLSPIDWEELTKPESFDDSESESYDQFDTRYDEFVNISVGKNRHMLVTDDDLDNEIADDGTVPVQQGKESRRAKMMAAYGKVKELAKDKVNEKIIPVLKQRKRPDSSLSSPLMPTVAGQDSKTDTLSASSMETTQAPSPSTGLRNRKNKPAQKELDSSSPRIDATKSSCDVWETVQNQKNFYRTRVAPRINGNYQWKYETFNAQVKPEFKYLLIGVWEKIHGKDEQTLVGKLSIPISRIYSKAHQTIGKKFVRKVRMECPRNFTNQMIKDCVGELATNRGFRSEMAFGELTLKIGISSDDETEGEEEPSVEPLSTPVENQIFPGTSTPPADASMGSRGRKLIGNIKQKFWTKGREAEHINVTPEPKLLTERSRSDSHISLKSEKSDVNIPNIEINSDTEEFFIPLDSKDSQDEERDCDNVVEVGTPLDERDAHFLNDVNKYYPLKLGKSLVAKNQDDMLAVFAKEEGQRLHRDLPEKERKNKIESTISKIESEIDVEVSRKKQLESDLKSSGMTSNIEIHLKKCKERLNALTMLSMSYQAGMNDADSPESQEHPIQSN